jgi:DNA replication and repair protein RecF
MAYLKSLFLFQFRNYERAEIHLGPHINLFIGKNGQGKTNCLEAIALLIAGKSFRTSHLKELMYHEKSEFALEAIFDRYCIEQTLLIHYTDHKKQMRYNEKLYSSFVPLIGLLQGVYFSSYQNQLIKGAPSIRRRFLDLQCSQIDPLYLHHLRRYQTALKERNVLLKEKQTKSLELYDVLMAESAPYLLEQRKKALKELQKLAQEKHYKLTKLNDQIEFIYLTHPRFDSTVTTPELFLEVITKERGKDLKLGYSSTGPHRDDLLFNLNGSDAKKFASEGQIQSLITALYLAEYQRLLNNTDETPLFCIDDIGQNLDASRLQSLYEMLDQMGQVFITTPELPSYTFKGSVQLFEIDQGQIRARNPLFV